MPHKITISTGGKNFQYYDTNSPSGYIPDFVSIGQDEDAGSSDWASLVLSATQTTNLSSGNAVNFNVREGGTLTLTGNNLRLTPGDSYYCVAYMNDATNSGVTGNLYRWYNSTNGTYFDNVITPTQEVDIYLRIVGSGLTSIYTNSNAFIQAF